MVPCVFSFVFCGFSATFSVPLFFFPRVFAAFLANVVLHFCAMLVGKGCGALPYLPFLPEEFYFLRYHTLSLQGAIAAFLCYVLASATLLIRARF